MLNLNGLQEPGLCVGRLKYGLNEADMAFADVLVRGAEILVPALGLGRCREKQVGDAA